jgi:uncharacterized Zn-binding protein involved in type VI secretion
MPKGGRPFGETSYSGKGLMTKYTRGFTGSRTMKVSGKKATSNGRKLMKGQAARTKGWRSSP